MRWDEEGLRRSHKHLLFSLHSAGVEYQGSLRDWWSETLLNSKCRIWCCEAPATTVT
jgi:hypothetical protein